MAFLGKYMSIFFLVFAILLSAFTSISAEIYKVGDVAGWSLNHNVNYTAWASSKIFKTGDTVVFVYNKELHNVMQVSRDDYHKCNISSPLATYNSGDDHIPIVWKGHYFYISGNPGDCAAGQKVDIRVPTGRGNIYKVGDAAGWSTSSNVNYSAWASSKTFRVGDTIVFRYKKQLQNVMQVNRDDYHSCNTASPIAIFKSGNDHIPIMFKGHYYYISGIPGHCAAGQKVDIRVILPPSPASSPSEDPSSTSAPALAPESSQASAASTGPSTAVSLLAIAVAFQNIIFS